MIDKHYPDLQSIFDRVSTHLLKQGVRSMDNDTKKCMYRGANGTSCAVGCLIKDEHYHPSIEGRPVDYYAVAYALKLSEIDTSQEVIDLLLDMQALHDSGSPDTWKECLTDLARDYRLEVTF